MMGGVAERVFFDLPVGLPIGDYLALRIRPPTADRARVAAPIGEVGETGGDRP